MKAVPFGGYSRVRSLKLNMSKPYSSLDIQSWFGCLEEDLFHKKKSSSKFKLEYTVTIYRIRVIHISFSTVPFASVHRYPKISRSPYCKNLTYKRNLFSFLAENYDATRANAITVISCTTAYPFRVNDKSVLCVYCQELFEDPDIFRQHMETEHDYFSIKVAFHHLPKNEFIKVDLTNLRCRTCKEQFQNLDLVLEHVANVHGKKTDPNGKLGVMPYYLQKDVYNCAVCEKNFPTLFHLNRHTISHFLSYVCDVCGSSYVATTGLLKHMRSKHQTYEVSCKRCRKVFPTMEEKEKHSRTEKSCMPYCCPKCMERFLDWKSRRRHMEVAHGLTKKTYKCAECNIDFTTENSYYIHFKLNHSEDCVVCKFCGAKFVSEFRLKRHMSKHAHLFNEEEW